MRAEELPSIYRPVFDEEDEYSDDDEIYVIEHDGCLLPSLCLCTEPGHRSWQCYTAADAEEWAAEGAEV